MKRNFIKTFFIYIQNNQDIIFIFVISLIIYKKTKHSRPLVTIKIYMKDYICSI